MNVYSQIDAIFSGESEEVPQWAKDILKEVREVKQLLIEQQRSQGDNDREYYNFLKIFRTQMRADVEKDLYPSFCYDGIEYGVDRNGLLYEKGSGRTVTKNEAFEIYRYAYQQQKNSHNIA